MANLSGLSLTDPYITRFVNDVADIMKLEVLQSLYHQQDPANFPLRLTKFTVGGKIKRQYDSVGMVMRRYLDKPPGGKRALFFNQPAEKTSTGRGKVGLSINIARPIFPIELKNLTHKLGVDFKNQKYVLSQTKVKQVFSYFQPEYAVRSIDAIKALLEDIESGESGNNVVLNQLLKFEVEKVKCVDETDPEFLGKDHIHMGGTQVDDKENQVKIGQVEVGDFNDGDFALYNPPYELSSFPLDEKYPKDFAIFLSIAEKDNGGFADFLSELYDAIKAELELIFAALGAWAGAEIGAVIGSSVGTTIGGPIGTILGTIAGFILGAVVGWIVSALRDDIFEPQIASIHLPTGDATFEGGSLTSPSMTLVYIGHGGKYKLVYRWRIVR
jgi:hypothetical protein